MTKKSVKLLLVILLLILITGCKDSIEIEEQGYVILLGYDKSEKGDDMLEITYQIANPQVGAQSQTQTPKEPSEVSVTILTEDAVMARDLINVSVSRTIEYAHTKAIIVSEELARTETFKVIFDEITRDPQLRKDALLIVCKDKAKDFINKYKPPLETRIHKNIGYMMLKWEKTGLVPKSTLLRLSQTIKENNSSFLAIYGTVTNEENEQGTPKPGNKYKPGEVPKTGDNPTQLIGAAVIKNGKMIGTLDLEETRAALLINKYSEVFTWHEVIPDPLNKGSHITVKIIREQKNRYRFDLNSAHPKIDIEVRLNVQIMLIKSLTDYSENKNNQELLKKTIEDKFKTDAENIIKRSQTEFESDIFNLSLLAQKKFFSVPQYEQYNWIEKYPKTDVSVSVKITITQFGKSTKSLDDHKFKE